MNKPFSLIAIICFLLLPGNIVSAQSSPPEFQYSMGTLGTNDGQFDFPSGVAIDRGGNIIVADEFNHRIQVFDANGNFRFTFGTLGNGDGELDGPFGISLDSQGNIYVADQGNNRIQVFATDGTFQSKFGAPGTAEGELDSPGGVAVDASGYAVVSDQYNNRIQVWGVAQLDPLPLLGELINRVSALVISAGTKESLLSKLDGAKAKIADEKLRKAVKKLRKFIKKVRKKARKKRRNKIDPTDADDLIARASVIIDLLIARIEGS
jgi:DNA-binding beta-propeller fold protein YncE